MTYARLEPPLLIYPMFWPRRFLFPSTQDSPWAGLTAAYANIVLISYIEEITSTIQSYNGRKEEWNQSNETLTVTKLENYMHMGNYLVIYKKPSSRSWKKIKAFIFYQVSEFKFHKIATFIILKYYYIFIWNIK